MENFEIIEGIKNGDSKTMTYIYDNNHFNIQKIINECGEHISTKDDIFQDAIIGVMENINKDGFVLDCKFSTYFYKICKNLAHKSYNTSRKLCNIGNDYSAYDTYGEEMKISSLEDDMLNICINELSENRRNILNLCYFEKLSNKEIAEKLNFANADSIKTQKYKAMKDLEKIIFGKNLVKENFINN